MLTLMVDEWHVLLLALMDVRFPSSNRVNTYR